MVICTVSRIPCSFWRIRRVIGQLPYSQKFGFSWNVHSQRPRHFCQVIKSFNGKSGDCHTGVGMRVAVIGAGFMGLALTYHLLAIGSKLGRLHVKLYDAHGIGTGASGAAAGILHPCSPKRKVTWNGLPAMAAAINLIKTVAEGSKMRGNGPVYWSNGAIRLGTDSEQIEAFSNLENSPAHCISVGEASQLLPGIGMRPLPASSCAGLWIPEGIVVHPRKYMRELWQTCRDFAASHCNTHVEFGCRRLRTLSELSGECDAVILATGAATETIKELEGVMQMSLCQGYTLEMSSPLGGSDIEKYPSILGPTYIGFQGQSGLVVGSTKDYDWDASRSLAEAGKVTIDKKTCAKDVAYLCEEATRLWKPSREWRVNRIQSGVRASTRSTNDGLVPYAGQIDTQDTTHPSCWIATGLGARGVLYHAWLGELVANAVLRQDESTLPVELLRWKGFYARR